MGFMDEAETTKFVSTFETNGSDGDAVVRMNIYDNKLDPTISVTSNDASISDESILNKSTKRRIANIFTNHTANKVENGTAYTNFMHKSYEAAQVWRPRQVEDMTLYGRAKRTLAKIITEYRLKEELKACSTQLNENEAINIFKLVPNHSAVKSVRVVQKRVKSLPDKEAKKLGWPDLSEKKLLFTENNHDKLLFEQRASLSKRSSILRRKECSWDRQRKQVWDSEFINIKCKLLSNFQKDLACMKVVWEDITELDATRGFCKWLLDHSSIPKPQYLEQIGLLNEVKLNERVDEFTQKKMEDEELNK